MASHSGSVVIVNLMATQQTFSWPISQQVLTTQSWNFEATWPGFTFQLCHALAPWATFQTSVFTNKMDLMTLSWRLQ